MNIPLGFEIGTGEAVDVPRDHMAVTGRTQESGKSTTIEALVSRSKAPALAFVTKRGERSFRKARMIAPFYRGTIDPDSIAALLSSAVGEKMQGKLGEIIWLCEGHRGGRGKNTYSWPAAESLADVLRNCETALSNATDRESQRLYTVLRHYLRGVVKQVETLPRSAKIDLQPALNVMDLREFEPGTQSLIIHDSVMWVAEKGRGVTTIIPEAWKFVGQGKKSPVLSACEELIRQGGTLGNYLWLDSQDLVLHTNVLRSVGVYILGVQRERNEVKRVLDYIPDAFPKLKRSDIQKLDIGQFWVCYKRKTTLTYVMPEWGNPTYCRSVALGMAAPPEPPKISRQQTVGSRQEEKHSTSANETETPGDQMWKEKFEEEQKERIRLEMLISGLRFEIKTLEDTIQGRVAQTSDVEVCGTSVTNDKPQTSVTPAQVCATVAEDLNGFYAAFKARLLTDPQVILALATVRPEIEITVTRQKLQIDGATMAGRLGKLLANHFFDEPRKPGAVRAELERTGPGVDPPSLSRRLAELKVNGFLTEDGGKYQAVPGMDVRIVET